jgi:hypothetical protein
VSDRIDSLRRKVAQLRAELAALPSEYKRVLAMLERLNLQVDSFSDLLEMSPDAPGPDQGNPTAYTNGQGALMSSSAYEVRCVEVFGLADGSAQVRIDDGPLFRLPCGSIDFLLFLVAGSTAADGLPQWRSRLSIRAWLEERNVREVSPKLVNHRVHTLRAHLRAAGMKKHVVHTHPQLGVRFALRNPESGLLRRVLGGGDRR